MPNNNIWKKIQLRDDDVVVASTIKSGTTWIQQIFAQLIFQGEFHGKLSETSIWIDNHRDHTEDEIINMMENQKHRRFIKTHSPSNVVL